MMRFDTCSREVLCPFDALSSRNPLPDVLAPPGLRRVSPEHLVAGFHTRFGPPTPFLTTWTVYASSNPVVSFNHSRP